jgi:hypothetical protein
MILASDESGIGFWSAVIILGVVAAWIGLLFLPGSIAKSRNHPSRDAIHTLALLGFFIPILWLVALVWAFSVPAVVIDPHQAPPGRVRAKSMNFDPELVPAAVESVPGLYVVSGVDRDSKMDTVWRVQADSEANARVKAELEGIVVTGVERDV